MTAWRPQHTATARLHAPLAGARLAAPAEPDPEPPAAPAVSPSALLPAEPLPPETPAPPPPDPWEGEIGRRLQEERAVIERTLGAMTREITALEAWRREEAEGWKRAAAELGVAIAARILHTRISAGDFPAEEVVREMVGQAGPGPLAVYLHPEDLELLRSRVGGGPLTDEPGRITLRGDPALGRGDCRVEGRDALVLARLPDQLEDMRRQLLRSLGHGSL